MYSLLVWPGAIYGAGGGGGGVCVCVLVVVCVCVCVCVCIICKMISVCEEHFILTHS